MVKTKTEFWSLKLTDITSILHSTKAIVNGGQYWLMETLHIPTKSGGNLVFECNLPQKDIHGICHNLITSFEETF